MKILVMILVMVFGYDMNINKDHLFEKFSLFDHS